MTVALSGLPEGLTKIEFKVAMENSLCTIYCTGNVSIEDLRRHLSVFFNLQPVSASVMENDSYNLSVQYNEAYNPIDQKVFPDGFLYFKFIIECEFFKEKDVTDFVN